MEDTIIVGAGPIGLACAISAKRRGRDPLVLDAGAIANSIVRYPIGMHFFTTPERLEIGGHPLTCAGPKATREEALKYYRGVVRTEGIRTRTFTPLMTARREPEGIRCILDSRTGERTLWCHTLVLATGYFDHPNRLGVEGEERPHVRHHFDEGHLGYGLDVVVVGGKNSAVEAALQLYRAGARVTLVHRRSEFSKSVKYWLRPDIENRIAAGEIEARLGATVRRFDADAVVIRTADGGEESLPADRVHVLIGFQPDFALFERIGIRCDPESGKPAIDPDTLETNVPSVYLAGSVTAGRAISEVFIENGRFDGEKIFGTPTDRARIDRQYRTIQRPRGE